MNTLKHCEILSAKLNVLLVVSFVLLIHLRKTLDFLPMNCYLNSKIL